MILALDGFADNPIIDELLCQPPRAARMIRIRACNVMFRKPFVEVTLQGGEVFQRHFPRPDFAAHWAEASVILATLTSAEIVSEFEFVAVADRDELVRRVLECRDRCISEANLMYDHGLYDQYLQQFGPDCRDLPADTLQRILQARERIASG